MNEIQYTAIVNEILPGAKIFKLKGFSGKNADYSKAKTPPYGYKWKEEAGLTESEIHVWLNGGGWIGAVIPENRIVVDVDDSTQGELVKEVLEAENVHHHSIKTPNGWQFVFKSEDESTKGIKQIAKFFTQLGVIIDTRTAGAGYIVFPTSTTEGRYVASRSVNQLDEPPYYIRPLKSRESTKIKETGEYYEFPIPLDESGSRNDALYKFAARLRVWNVPLNEIRQSMELIYEHFVIDKSDFPLKELHTLTQSAINWKPAPSNFQMNLVEDDFSKGEVIPLPFQIERNTLFKTVTKKVDGFEVEQNVMVSRMAPKIKRELSNVERNSVHYEISWVDRGRPKNEIVGASTLSTKRELLMLSDHGFPVNDLNYKDLIKYFDSFLALNQLEQSRMVDRLGHIRNAFIHPLDSDDIEVVPNDIGERQILEAFEAKGTVDTWKNEVFERIKNHPKVLFLVLSSFASVILHDLKVSSFIVDLSGSTSQGKTTALQVARTVWGSEGLINEWNATRVAVERKAGFLNSFPLYMDDTRKANEKLLQSIIYQFSGGRSKGRGSIKGSQIETTWNSILISTGEVSLSDYASKAGGAAARIIPLIDEPFHKSDYEYFSGLYPAIQNNYGAVGIAFIKEWQKQKEVFLPQFYRFKDFYMEKAKGNEVLIRLSMYYAAVHFVGSVLKEMFNLDFDLKQLDRLFNEIAEENKSLDKPKELLEQILNDLNSSRRSIYYLFEPDFIKAIYHYNTICLTPAYLKEFLGPEEKLIRREWVKRGYTKFNITTGKDYWSVKHDGKTYRVIIINTDIIDSFGYDFSSNSL
jgi:putative DNA primase/helicase